MFDRDSAPELPSCEAEGCRIAVECKSTSELLVCGAGSCRVGTVFEPIIAAMFDRDSGPELSVCVIGIAESL